MIIRADNEDKKLVIRKRDSKLYINICLNLLTIIWLHEIDFIIKYNGVLAEHTIKNNISQLLSQYKHRNNIQEHEKQ